MDSLISNRRQRLRLGVVHWNGIVQPRQLENLAVVVAQASRRTLASRGFAGIVISFQVHDALAYSQPLQMTVKTSPLDLLETPRAAPRYTAPMRFSCSGVSMRTLPTSMCRV